MQKPAPDPVRAGLTAGQNRGAKRGLWRETSCRSVAPSRWPSWPCSRCRSWWKPSPVSAPPVRALAVARARAARLLALRRLRPPAAELPWHMPVCCLPVQRAPTRTPKPNAPAPSPDREGGQGCQGPQVPQGAEGQGAQGPESPQGSEAAQVAADAAHARARAGHPHPVPPADRLGAVRRQERLPRRRGQLRGAVGGPLLPLRPLLRPPR
jgi:hypothetical protein